MKDEFLATVSHELRTPLTSILGALGLLAGGAAGPLPAPALSLAQVAERNGKRLNGLIDDILDTGLTTLKARDLLTHHGASDVRVCVLLDKPSRRVAAIAADFIGFTIPNVFAVGYGLDHDNRYRELPDLMTLETGLP